MPSASAAPSQPHSRLRPPKDDLLYAHGIARRAVARAALHLGIDSMTCETLDTLSSCLLGYLERLGGAIAHTAEAAGRTSAHCHVLDALAAVELCTPPAAAKMTHATSVTIAGGNAMETMESNVNGEVHVDGNPSGSSSSWKDLAAFCFGPQWHLPSSSNLLNGALGEASESAAGWNAPYPEEVPHFPRVLNNARVANPHPFAEPKLHRTDVTLVGDSSEPDALNDDDAIPDSAYQDAAGWGGFRDDDAAAKSGDKRSLDAAVDDEEEDRKPPATKKVKLHDGTSAAAAEGSEWADALRPTFYPPFPTHHSDEPRVILTESAATLKTDTTSSMYSLKAKPTEKVSDWDGNNPTRLLVRSALLGSRTGVHRGGGGDSQMDASSSASYWGALDRVVPAGRPAADSTAGVAPSIVPIGRASGSRVSRILEGSMEPPVL